MILAINILYLYKNINIIFKLDDVINNFDLF